MDGMFYQRNSDDQSDRADLVSSVAKLLLISLIVSIGIVGALLLLSWAGANVTMPSEFPIIAPDAG